MDRNKKRISHVGQPISKHKSDQANDDFVDSIMKEMDANISNFKYNKLSCHPPSEKGTVRNNMHTSSALSSQPNTVSQRQKKFLPAKRHPLMEKVQKNKDYYKHLRSVPKQRAHLSGFEEPVRRKEEKGFKRSSHCNLIEKKKKSSHSTTSSKGKVSDSKSKLPSPSSDSESDFESFIHDQKLNTKCEIKSSTKRKKKHKDRTKCKTFKGKTCTKRIKRKSEQLEDEDNRSDSDPNISCKVTATNRLKLPETSESSDSSADESESSKSLSKNRVESCKEIDINNSECTVQIERNPHLDKTVAELNFPNYADDYEVSSQLKQNKSIDLTKCKDTTALDYDEDCLIVCELPKSCNNSDIFSTEGGDSKSDIQISNVVTLKDEEIVIMNEIDEVSLTQSSCDNSYGANFENSNEIIEQGSQFSAVQVATGLNNSSAIFAANMSGCRIPTNTDSNFNDIACSSVSTNSGNDFNKKELEKILFLANSVGNDKSSLDTKVFDSLDCSSSSTDLRSENVESIAEEHWLNIKKAINLSNCTSPNVSNCDLSVNTDPSDKLDVLVAASIRKFIDPSFPNVSRIYQRYTQILQEYNKIKDSEHSLTDSFKLFLESIFAEKKYLEIFLEHLIKHDPCFYTAIKNSQGTVVYNSSSVQNTGNEVISSNQIKICANCGLEATIECQRCKKVYFCTTECGISVWENGHYSSCEGGERG